MPSVSYERVVSDFSVASADCEALVVSVVSLCVSDVESACVSLVDVSVVAETSFALELAYVSEVSVCSTKSGNVCGWLSEVSSPVLVDVVSDVSFAALVEVVSVASELVRDPASDVVPEDISEFELCVQSGAQLFDFCASKGNAKQT